MKILGPTALLIFLSSLSPLHASGGPQPIPKAEKPGQGISEETKKKLATRRNLEQQTLSDEDLSGLFKQPSSDPGAKKPETKPEAKSAQQKKTVLSFFKRKK